MRSIIIVALLVGCRVSPQETAVSTPGLSGPAAEALARSQLSVPPAASLISVASTADPAPASVLPAALTNYLSGPARSRGQRVVARFALPLDTVNTEFWSDWRPLPLPQATGGFVEGPSEIAGMTGYFRCSVSAASPSSERGWISSSCSEPPANFDSYEVAAYDPAAGQLTVIVKQYY